MASPANQHCANCVGTLLFPTDHTEPQCPSCRKRSRGSKEFCRLRPEGLLAGKGKQSIAVRNTPHRYGNSHAI